MNVFNKTVALFSLTAASMIFGAKDADAQRENQRMVFSTTLPTQVNPKSQRICLDYQKMQTDSVYQKNTLEDVRKNIGAYIDPQTLTQLKAEKFEDLTISADGYEGYLNFSAYQYTDHADSTREKEYQLLFRDEDRNGLPDQKDPERTRRWLWGTYSIKDSLTHAESYRIRLEFGKDGLVLQNSYVQSKDTNKGTVNETGQEFTQAFYTGMSPAYPMIDLEESKHPYGMEDSWTHTRLNGESKITPDPESDETNMELVTATSSLNTIQKIVKFVEASANKTGWPRSKKIVKVPTEVLKF